MSGPALFPKPEPDIPKLSQKFSTAEYRNRPGVKVKWARKAPRARADCDECTALQHETAGAYWPRRQIRGRRTANDTTLDLCSAHIAAWKDRDTTNGGVT